MCIKKIFPLTAAFFLVCMLLSVSSSAAEETRRLAEWTGYGDLIRSSPVGEDMLKGESLLETAKSMLLSSLEKTVRKLPPLIVIVVLMWFLKTVCPKKNEDLIRSSVETYVSVYLLTMLIEDVMRYAREIVRVKDELGGILTSTIGVIVTCAQSKGYAGTGSVAVGWFTVELSVFLFVIETLLLPLLSLFFCIGVASGVTEGKVSKRLSAFLRNLCVTLLSVVTTVFSSAVFLSVRAHAPSDSLLQRTAIVTLGKSIPVVGSVLGKNLDVVSLCLDDIIGKSGLYAIVLTGYYLLPVLISVVMDLLLMSGLQILFSVGEFERVNGMFSACKDALVLLVAVICTYAFSTVIGFGVLMGIGTR